MGERAHPAPSAVVGWLLALAACLGAPSAVDAASVAGAAERPRIGLVLAGGSALGCAHVGALRALEELRVPVDCIAGTSMGAVIGGLYAMGMTPDQIERQILAEDWADLFSDAGSRRDLSFRRKEDDRRHLLNIELGVKRGRIILPTGLIAGQKLGFELERLTMGVAGVRDFDKLPIPFRAVATDIVTGEMVALRQGNLAEALRASTSIPGVFSPVDVDGRLLVDGAVVRNLPVDVARQMGADVVIAIDLDAPLGDRKSLESAFEISRQTLDILTRQNVIEQRALANVVITPDLAGIGGAEFHKAAEMIRRGEAAVMAHAEALRAYAVSPEEYEALRAGRQVVPQPGPVPVSFIDVEGTGRVDTRRIESRISTRPGSDLDIERLRRDLARVYEIGEFERVEFRVARKGDQSGLVIRANDKPWGPHYVRFGIHMSDDLEGHSYADLLLEYRRASLDALGGEWRVNLQSGRTRRLFSEFYQPLDLRGRFFVAPAIDLEHTIRERIVERRKVAERGVSSVGGACDLGLELGPYGEGRVGATRKHVRTDADLGEQDLPAYNARIGGWTARLALDRLDDSSFPRQGSIGSVDLFSARRAFGAEQPYDKLSGSYTIYGSRGRHTLFAGGAAGSHLSGKIPVYDLFRMGGLFSFSGYSDEQLWGQYFGVARAGYFLRMGKLPSAVGTRVYLGAWGEAGNVWQDRRDPALNSLRYAGTIALGAGTVLGPLYVAWGAAEAGQDHAYIALGRGP